MNGKRVDAIITARGGSKGLPRKNIQLLAGKPLIAYTIEAALQCRFITRCLVSTEDPEIKRVSLRYGAEVVDRPQKFAGDFARSQDAVKHVLETLRKEGDFPEYFALLQPTSPLRTAGHLEACIKAFFKSGAACAISVAKFEHHPLKAFGVRRNRLVPVWGDDKLDTPRQKLPVMYEANGAIFVMASKTLLRKMNFFVHPAMPFVMSQHDSMDIDTSLNLRFCELLIKEENRAH